MNAIVPYRGRKNLFGSASGSSSPDNLFTDDIVELILGVCEGPIQGLVAGPQSIMFNDTPLVNEAGTPVLGNQQGVNVNGLGTTNFGEFDVEMHLGYDPPDTIQSKLGGFGNTHSVQVLLDTNTPVVRTGSVLNIDFISFRIMFQALYSVDTSSGAQSSATGTFKIEYKAHSASTWNSTYTTVNPTPGAVASSSTATQQSFNASGNGGTQSPNNYRETWIQPTQPASQTIGAVWFNSSLTNYDPKVLQSDGVTWATPSGATYNAAGSPYPYWTWTESGQTVHAYVAPSRATPPSGLTTADLWIVKADATNGNAPQSYIYNETGWVTNIAWNLPGPATPGIINVTGQTSGGYVAEYRIPVARINEVYDVRVTKITGENATNFVCNMEFDSFIELVNTPMSFPGLALLYASVRSTDQFSSLPTVALDLYGLIVKVPSNYDPVAKTYTGIWDGTWKNAYSANPAYIAKALIENTRFGINSYYPASVDQDSVYAFGKHCDAHGFSYNEIIQDARPISEAINIILAVAGGFWAEFGDGTSVILFDSDTDPAVALFTPENVSDGVFTYSRTDITARKNDLIVSYIDPNQNWIENRRRVSDPVSMANYGRNADEFVAAGCIDETEAIKRARLRLAIATTECTIVDFKTNRAGLYLSPYKVILVADPKAAFGYSGRINSVVNSTTVKLRDPVTLEAGFTYTLSFQIPDNAGGYTVWSATVLNAAGTTSTLQSSVTLPSLPDFAAFTLGSTDPNGAPKAFRITSIDEQEGDPDIISISAIEINRSKWAYVDGLVSLTTQTVTGTNTGASVAPPTNPSVVSQVNNPNQIDLLISWTPSVTPLTRQTNIYYSLNGGSSTELASVSGGQTNFLLQNVVAGDYLFALTAQNFQGFESLPTQIDFVVGGALRLVAGPTYLALVNAVSPGVFASKDAMLTWTASTDPHLYAYVIKVLDSTTHAVVRSAQLLPSTTSWTYTYSDNSNDGGGVPRRNFTISLVAIDNAGNSSAPLLLACNNPVPSAPSNVTATALNFAVSVSYNVNGQTDIAGCRVYASTANPVQIIAGNLIYDGPNTQVGGPLDPDVTMYYAVGLYDTFDGTLSATTTVQAVGKDAFVTLQAIDATITSLLSSSPSGLIDTTDEASQQAVDAEEAQSVAALVSSAAARKTGFMEAAAATAAAQQALTTAAAAQNQNLATLMQMSTTVSGNFGTLSGQITTLAATTSDANSNVTTRVDLLASSETADGDQGEVNSFLQAWQNGNLSKSAQLSAKSALAAIATVQTSVTSLNSAMAAVNNQILSKVGANFATFNSFVTTQASSDAATATSITNLTTTVSNNYTDLSGQITTLNTTVTTNQSTNVTSINNLTATVGSNYTDLSNQIVAANAAITNSQNAQATVNSSTATTLTNLTTTVDDNYTTLSGQISTFENAQSTTNTSVATSITHLTSSVDDDFTNLSGQISTLATSTTDANSNVTTRVDLLASSETANEDQGEVNAFLEAWQSGKLSKTAQLSANSALAGIATLQTSVTSLNSAISSLNTQLMAKVGANFATYNAFVTTQATTNTSTATSITNLNTSVGTINGNITSLQTSVSNNLGTSAVKSDTVSASSNVTADGAEVEAFLNAVQSQQKATVLQQMAAQGIAATTTQTNAQLTTMEALASVQTVLVAGIGNAVAGIANEATVRASADISLANTMSTLQAAIGDHSGISTTISSFQAAQATLNDSTAASISSLNSNYGTLSANVSNYQTTQATQNSTFAGQITNIQAQSNAGTANGSIQFAATSTNYGGATAAYSIQVSTSNNGQNFIDAGINLIAGNGFSRVQITAGSFILKAGSSFNQVFSANSDGTLTLNAVTNVSSILKSQGLGGNGQPYMTQNFGSSPSIIIDDGT